MQKKKIIATIASLAIFFCASLFLNAQAVYQRANDYTINLARAFGRELFDLNGVPYLQPLVETINSTSNSGFFNRAYVPKNVEKPYFRVGLKGMLGFVRDDMKSYSPNMPNEPLDTIKLFQYINFKIDLNDPRNPKFVVTGIPDTAALILYAFKVYAHRGLETKLIKLPESAPTILGYDERAIYIPRYVLDSLVRSYPVIPIINKPLFDVLPDSLRATILMAVGQFPEYFTLPKGGNINSIIAGIPQLEIGSLYGTELLLRFIPPVYMGENIGDFSFWGLGLKHSLSQYFESPIDIAFQTVYQGTYLNNKVGVTNSELKALATIWDFNLEFGKRFEDIIDFYAGFSYELLSIKSDFTYYLPIETQAQLGLLEMIKIGELPNGQPIYRILPPDASRGFPGDTEPQKTKIKINDENFKFIFGLSRSFGPVTFFIDYSLSKFNILSGGIEFKF